MEKKRRKVGRMIFDLIVCVTPMSLSFIFVYSNEKNVLQAIVMGRDPVSSVYRKKKNVCWYFHNL